MIVQLDGQLVAIACGICKANAIPGNPGNPPSKFFNGMRGLQSHMMKGHGAKGIGLDEIAARCHRTILSVSDTRLVKSGRKPLMRVEMVTMTDNSTENETSEVVAAAGNQKQEASTKTPKEAYAIAVAKAMGDPLWPSLHAAYPMVVRISGQPFAIACHLCGANAKAHHWKSSEVLFMAGVNGLLHHIGRSHPESGRFNRQAVIDHCQRTSISAADERRIEMGQAPVAQIMMIKFQKVNQAQDAIPEEADDEKIAVGGSRRSSRASSPAVWNKSASRFDSISDNFPTVVRGDDAWESIRCHLCGANARCPKRDAIRYMRGMFGLATHYRQSHPRDESWSNEEVYSLCTREQVDPKVADAMLAGRDITFVMDMDLGSDAAQLADKGRSDGNDERETSGKHHTADSTHSDGLPEPYDELDEHGQVASEPAGQASHALEPQNMTLASMSTPLAPRTNSQSMLIAGAVSLWNKQVSPSTNARPGPQRSSLPAMLGKRAGSPDMEQDRSSDSDRPLKNRKTDMSRVGDGNGASRKSF